jgi:two-component system alkaline phosphatase synthesis response regulator PhoP
MSGSLIYVLEDDDNIRGMLLYALNSSGFTAEGFSQAGAFFEGLRKQLPALALLDIMLPGEDGLSVLQRLRADAATQRLPVIMLTARGTEADRVQGLNDGADDYVAKPFSVVEVIARIRAVLRRADAGAALSASKGGDKDAPNAATVTAGGITLDTQRRAVTCGESGTTVEGITYKEFELLRLLMRNAGIVLNRDTILDRVWGQGYYGDTRTVDMHIKTLRQKLGPQGSHIVTVRNVGYKFDE